MQIFKLSLLILEDFLKNFLIVTSLLYTLVSRLLEVAPYFDSHNFINDSSNKNINFNATNFQNKIFLEDNSQVILQNYLSCIRSNSKSKSPTNLNALKCKFNYILKTKSSSLPNSCLIFKLVFLMGYCIKEKSVHKEYFGYNLLSKFLIL